jgi:hypothetical protein
VQGASPARRLWLTDAAIRQSVEALRLRRGRRGEDEPADDDLRKAAGENATVSWGILRQRLRHARLPNSRHAESIVGLSKLLLGGEIADITTEVAPRALAPLGPPGEVTSARTHIANLEVNCPQTVYDHRIVIIGQLPMPGLFPAVFVQPRDGSREWYPQCGPHNPLQAQSAFACLAHFGNPDGIGHVKALPLTLDVRVYALGSKWTHGSGRLDVHKLDECVGQLGMVTMRSFEVTRQQSGVNRVTVSHRKGTLPPDCRVSACVAPVRFRWRGDGSAFIDVRLGTGDDQVCYESVASGVILTLPDRKEPPHKRILRRGQPVVLRLPAGGLYRVRLYPQQWTFIDPRYEWWLDIS